MKKDTFPRIEKVVAACLFQFCLFSFSPPSCVLYVACHSGRNTSSKRERKYISSAAAGQLKEKIRTRTTRTQVFLNSGLFTAGFTLLTTPLVGRKKCSHRTHTASTLSRAAAKHARACVDVRWDYTWLAFLFAPTHLLNCGIPSRDSIRAGFCGESPIASFLGSFIFALVRE